MRFSLRFLLETIFTAGTVGSLFYYVLSFAGLVSFLRVKRRNSKPATFPGISILKPLKGVDPEVWDSFRSHCEQQYKTFELIFGVSDANDPVCDVVRRLQTEYSSIPIKLIVCDRVLGANIKVSNLAQMLPHATHDVLLVNDSDIRVTPNYLREIGAPLADPGVGLVTCLYRGAAAKTLGSCLESLSIATDFVPGVLSARLLEGGLHFGLGSTLLFRRDDLTAIGGFESFIDYLADDYELGRRIAAIGKRVELSEVVVDTFLPAYSFGEFINHQLRWWRTIRDARRWGYMGLMFTFGLPWAIATVLIADGAAWAWELFATTLAARLIIGMGTAIGVLHEGGTMRTFILLPLRDLITPVLWAAGLVSNRIHWRGEEFTLRDGRLERA
ncbi:MAG TPA: bacteriohopanetetrol glucosamine biosynthesis glycosyltransferase HpnI [Terriglobales bacterium]|nr:bacteriohopanetetrol glucosamine biosynthesis glycosyltransferase HpnI [Terriglobales bacterium]